MLKLREYRDDFGLTQDEVATAVRKRALERGDLVVPGLNASAVSKHERGEKRPGPYYQRLYCEVYKVTPVELGFRLALPSEKVHDPDVDRREFLASTASFMVALALPEPTRLGASDVERLRESLAHLYRLDDLHGAGSVYSATVSTFQRLHSLVQHASYNEKTGQALKELTGLAAEHAGWLAFDANRDDDARRWWTEAMQWGERAHSDSVSVRAMASMAVQASDQHRPREVLDLAQAAARRAATPLTSSVLLAREAVGHAGLGDAASARATLDRARNLAETRHDADPIWLDSYGPEMFASNEHRVALALNDFATAEESARTALALNDPVAYPRNQALYLTRLAEVLIQRRELDEAAAVAKQASVAAAGLASARVTRQLHAVTQNLAA